MSKSGSAQIVGLESDVRLRGLELAAGDDAEVEKVPVDSWFICIGGVPRTKAAANIGLATDQSGYLRTGTDIDSMTGALDG